MTPSAAFIFLNVVPYLDIKTLPSLDDKCAICTEPYLEGPRELRDALDAPVKMRCGHIFGHNCLVRWMLSGNFDNHCPFCRTQIVDESDLEMSDPNVVAPLVYFEEFVLDEIQDTSNRKQELLEHADQYRTAIQDIGCTASKVFNKDRVVMIWEEFLDLVSRKDEEDRLWELRNRDYWLERDRRDVAEAALRLEQQQELHRGWSRNRIAIIVSVAWIVIASRLGLLWDSYRNGALWHTRVSQIDVDVCGWLLATLIAIGSPWQLYVLMGLFLPGLFISFRDLLAIVLFGGLGLVNDILYLVVSDNAAGI